MNIVANVGCVISFGSPLIALAFPGDSKECVLHVGGCSEYAKLYLTPADVARVKALIQDWEQIHEAKR